MSIKTNGAEYKAYIQEQSTAWWPDGAYMDDVVLNVNGQEIGEDNCEFDAEKMADSDIVMIVYGSYYTSSFDRDPIELVTHFKRWRKSQTTVRIAVEVHKDNLELLKSVIKANGGKIAS